MALHGDRIYVGFGFGAIQAGLFLYEAYHSDAFGRLVVAEVLPQRVEAVRRSGGCYTVNIARRDRVEEAVIGPVEIFDPAAPADRAALIEAITAAEELATAIPSVDGYVTAAPGSLDRLLATGLARKAAAGGPRAVIYTAENDTQAAQKLTSAVERHLSASQREAVADRVRMLNTVIGKMSGVTAARAGLAPIALGDSQAFLVEEFNRILISQIDFPPGTFRRGLSLFEEKEWLVPFEEAKLYGHNAGHALAAYVAAAAGIERLADLAPAPGVIDFLHDAMVEESGPPLIAAYAGVDPLFTPDGFARYADDLLVRMVNPHLQDTAARVGRDPARKLGWNDRLIGAMRLALAVGVIPARYALGAAAALRMLEADLVADRRVVQSMRARLDALWEAAHPPAAEAERVAGLIEEGDHRLRRWQAAGCPDLARAFDWQETVM